MDVFNELLENIKIERENEKQCSKPYKCGNKITKKIQKVLEEIDQNRNHSWAVEMYNRNEKNMSAVALFYRGNKITYKEMFEKAFMYAKSLKALGYKKDDQIPICITNTPEFIYMLLAISFIGAHTHTVGEWFDKDYLKEILNKTNSEIIFIDDISYESIKNSICESNIKRIVCFSLTNSLKQGNEKTNPYAEIENKFHIITDNFEYIKNDYNGITFNEENFIKMGENYKQQVIENVDLNDISTITYTSGTTSPGRPKGVIQSNRSYITLSRFKESDVSGMPTMKNLTVLAQIPTYTHMELSCAISDTLYCGCTIALEPFYDKDFFPCSLVINKPNFVCASTGFWGNLCKLLNFDESWKHVNMPYLMIPTVTGEGCSVGEEKFFNLTARKHKFGTAKLPFPLSPVTFSIGGGTTESSGIFVTLYKSLQEKKLNHLIKKERLGLRPYKFAEIEVLDEFGNYCDVEKPGLLVAKNPCEMTGYTEEKLNQNTHVVDSKGVSWLSLGTYAYKDKTGGIKMKGRMGSDLILKNNHKIPYYYIEDTILSDTKNIMSCSVVSNNGILICHIEFQPFAQKSKTEIIKSIINRLEAKYEEEVTQKLYFRFRDNVESFPLDPSGKRSISTLSKIGIDEKTFSFEQWKKKYTVEKEKVKSLGKK